MCIVSKEQRTSAMLACSRDRRRFISSFWRFSASA